MYFLNGDHVYIKSRRRHALISDEIGDCIEQLKHINKVKRIFSLNFFARIKTTDDYRQLKEYINHIVADSFAWPVVSSLISQAPVTGNIIVEAFYCDTTLWQFNSIEDRGGKAVLFRQGDVEVLAGTVHDDLGESFVDNVEKACSACGRLLTKAGFPVNSIVRQWNYIENILGREKNEQRYQIFNNIRSRFYSNHFISNGYPSATGIGMDYGGVIIEFIAIKSDKFKTIPVRNPLQTDAHKYSDKVLDEMKYSARATPKFERARYLEVFDRKLIYISGTASIRGERTISENDPAEQTEVTIQNIQKLYSSEALEQTGKKDLRPVYGHARVYIKNRDDYKKIKKIFRSHYGNLPAVYLVADICREKLLVEIEGQVILEERA